MPSTVIRSFQYAAERGELSSIKVGTAGWNVPSRCRDAFAASGTHLERYARVFPIAEIDTSFYRHHRVTTYARWAESVSKNFRFAVKLPRALTHEQGLVRRPSATLERFIEEVSGLGRKLAVLLVQLPPSLAFASRAARGFFAVLTAALPRAVRIACEPRHASWSSPRADELLKQFGISRVAADPARWQHDATPAGDPRLAYFRLHGSPRVYFSNYEEERLEQLHHQLLRPPDSATPCGASSTTPRTAMPRAMRCGCSGGSGHGDAADRSTPLACAVAIARSPSSFNSHPSASSFSAPARTAAT